MSALGTTSPANRTLTVTAWRHSPYHRLVAIISVLACARIASRHHVVVLGRLQATAATAAVARPGALKRRAGLLDTATVPAGVALGIKVWPERPAGRSARSGGTRSGSRRRGGDPALPPEWAGTPNLTSTLCN